MLKRFILAIAIALAVTHARAAITITLQPEKVAVGAIAVLTVEGVDEGSIGEMKPTHFPRNGTYCIAGRPLKDPTPEEPQPPFIVFMATIPGEYLIGVAVPDGDGGIEVAEIIVTVTGEGPAPDPFPEPRPEPKPLPIPISELSVVVIYEATNRPSSETEALIALAEHARTRDYRLFRMEDKDLIGRTGKVPELLRAYFEAAGNQQVPVIVIGRTSPDGRFSIVAVEPLGDDPVATVKKWGG